MSPVENKNTDQPPAVAAKVLNTKLKVPSASTKPSISERSAEQRIQNLKLEA
jgi:hypothetical protein